MNHRTIRNPGAALALLPGLAAQGAHAQTACSAEEACLDAILAAARAGAALAPVSLEAAADPARQVAIIDLKSCETPAYPIDALRYR